MEFRLTPWLPILCHVSRAKPFALSGKTGLARLRGLSPFPGLVVHALLSVRGQSVLSISRRELRELREHQAGNEKPETRNRSGRRDLLGKGEKGTGNFLPGHIFTNRDRDPTQANR